MSHLSSRSNLPRFSCVGRGWSLPASRLLLTILVGQCRKGCEMSLAVEQMSGVRSVVGFGQCKFQHRGGSKPIPVSAYCPVAPIAGKHTLMAEYRALAISLSCSSRGLLPKISGSQNCPTAPFMCPVFPCTVGGAFTHCDGSRPTPHTI